MSWLIKKLKKLNLFRTNNLTDKEIKKHKRHGSESIDGEKFVYAHEGILTAIIINCRVPESCKFKWSLGFKLHDVITCKEQAVLESIKKCIWRRKYANSIQCLKLQNWYLFSWV